MKTISKILMALPLVGVLNSCNAQPKNAKTVTVKIYGNCEMCEETIEKAGTKKGEATVDWNKDTKLAVITYDSKKQTTDEILKRIAHSGYDNEKYLAPDEAYAALPACCKYERTNKKINSANNVQANQHNAHQHNTGNTEITDSTTAQKETNQLKPVFDAYFNLKNALVKSDAKTAAVMADNLVKAIDKADMRKMETIQHNTWMKVYKSIEDNAGNIARAQDLEKQRSIFVKLSESLIELAPRSGLDITVYQQHCPMYNDGKGADWLSTDNEVKNPYYGSQMLSCGKTVKTIR